MYYGIEITQRQLNGILRKPGLFRRKFKASINMLLVQSRQNLHFHPHRLVTE